MRIKFFVIVALMLVSANFVFPATTFAQYDTLKNSFKQLGAARKGAGYNDDTPLDPRLMVAQIIKVALAFIATIIFVLIIYAGYQWMTAQGNDEKIAKAKSTISNSVIGLIIVLSAYAITIAVTNLALGRNLGSGASKGVPLDDAVNRALGN